MRRVLVGAFLVVLAWLAAAGYAGPLAGRLSEVAVNDNAAFLPADAEAAKARRLAAEFSSRPTMPAVVVYERKSGITAEDQFRVRGDVAAFNAVPGVVSPIPLPLPSADGAAVQVVVPIDDTGRHEVDEVVRRLREVAASGYGLRVHVTGPAGLLADLIEVFKGIDVTLLGVTVIVVVVILLLVYRSPMLWLLPLVSVMVCFAVAGAVVYWLADAGVIDLNGQSQGILTVLVFGAGTDYALLLVARYRESLRRHEAPTAAMAVAWRGAAPAIVASGGTVIASLLCLLLSDLNSNRSLGPVAAIGIGATLLVMLTLLPALLLLGSRRVFWPLQPRREPYGNPGGHGVWDRVARLIARRARWTWVATSLGLAVLAFGLTQLDASGLGQSEQFVNQPDSVSGQRALARHYPAGAGSPATIVARAGPAEAVVAAARGVTGVDAVRVLPASPEQPRTPKLVNGLVLIQATLADSPDSEDAEQTVARLRGAVHDVTGADAVVGGFTAVNLDTRTALIRDREVIIPAVLAVIWVILAVLLRAIVAPLVLIATVVLSFAAALGLCGLLFTHVFGFAGADPSFPLFAFVFLVALGIDYNIFLMSRVRQELKRLSPQQATLRGLVVTGGVITSAGVVLAATFSALAVLPLVVLVELGTAVALGVLLDTIVVRSLLAPALTYDLGRLMWWPSRRSRITTTEA
ncbi:MAG: MMPL family transporter [Micromonosporaceae bacterium]